MCTNYKKVLEIIIEQQLKHNDEQNKTVYETLHY